MKTASEIQHPGDARRFVQTAEEVRNVGRKTIRGGLVTVGGQAARFALRLGSTAALARLLTPEDFGLVAMTTVIMVFAGLFKDAGLSMAVIQREKLTHEQVSTLFWINVALGTTLCLILIALSPAIAAFYREPRLIPIMCALSLSFVLGGFIVQHQALLRRQMRFGALAMAEVLSTSFGILVAISMALAGCGYWSLVGLGLGTTAGNLVFVWTVLPWRPSRPRRGTGVRPMLKFGGDVLAFTVLNFFSRNADNLLIGRYWGAIPLAFYEKAYSLLFLPVIQIGAPISSAAIPALSRVRSEPERFKRYYLSAIRLAASLGLPVVVAIALFADFVVLLWLGPQWMESARLFRYLALAALLGALSHPGGMLLLSLGLTQRYRRIGMVSAPVTVLGFALGLPYGPQGVAIAYSACMLLLAGPIWVWTHHNTGVSVREFLGALQAPVISSLLSGLGALACMKALGTANNPMIAAGAGLAVFFLLYAVLLLRVFNFWPFFAEIVSKALHNRLPTRS